MKARYKFIIGRKSEYPERIELEVYISRACRTYVATGYDIPTKWWDESRQCVKDKMTNALAINEYMRALRDRIESAELECIKYNRPFGKEQIRAAAESRPLESSADIYSLFMKYNDDDYRRNNIKEKTWMKHRTEINRLKQFLEKKFDTSVVSVSKFDSSALAEFDEYMQGIYKIATLGKLHHTIKMFFGRALDDKIIDDNPYRGFHVKKGHNQTRDALSEEQLAALENLDRNRLEKIDSRLVLTLDKLLLSCYCGLRISDNSSLLKSEVHKEKVGLVIDKVTEKQEGTRVVLPLAKLFAGKGEEIVKRYLDSYPNIETVFPPIPDAKVNERLKTLAMMAGIPFNLTFHVARHTCATILAEKTGNPFVVMKVLGHHDIKTSMIYIHNSYNAMINSLENVTW